MLTRRWLTRVALVATALLTTVACATGNDPDDGDGGSGSGAGGPNGPLAGYAHRQALTVTDGTPAEVAVSFELNHAQLVMDDKSAADGRDVRITYETTVGTVTELDRVIDPQSSWNTASSQIWFRTAAAVDGSGSYYVYYGNAAAGAAPANGSSVYDLWDDFEDGNLDPAWVFSGLNGAVGKVEELKGALRVTSTAQDFGGTADEIGVALRDFSGDFRLEAEVRSAGGSLGALSKAGGLTVRQSAAADARHLTIAIQQTPNKRVRLFRPTDGATTDKLDVDAPDAYPHLLRIDRTGLDASAAYLDLSGAWLQLGAVNTFANLTDPVMIGVPLSNNSGGDAWAEIEWLRANKIITPTPTASASGDEQNF